MVAAVAGTLPERGEDLTRVTCVHALGGLGVGALLKAWLRRLGLERDVVWHDLARDGLPDPFPPGSARLLVVTGVDGSVIPELMDRGAACRHLVLVGRPGLDPLGDPEVTVHEGQDLVLADDEIRAVVAARGLSLSAAAHHDLVDETGGWPRLLDMVLGAYRRGETLEDVALGVAETQPHVLEEVVRGLPEDLREPVRLLALAGDVMVEEVGVFGGAMVRAVAELRRMGLVRMVTADGRPAYRLVGLVASQAASGAGRMEPDRPHVEVLRRLSALREEAGIGDRGIGFAYRARDWRRCSELIDRWWPELTFTRAAAVLRTVEAELPMEYRRVYPGTWHRAEYRGLTPLGRAPVRLPASPEAASLAWRDGTAEPELRRALAAMIARRVQHSYRAAWAVVQACRPLADLNLGPSGGPRMGVAALWFLQAAVCAELVGEFDVARQLLRAGWALRAEDTTGVMPADLAGKLAAHAAWRGESAEAVSWISSGRPEELDPETWYHKHVLTGYEQAALLLAADRLDERAARAGHLRINRPLAVDEHWVARLAARVHHLLTWGDAAEAQRAIATAREERAVSLAGDGIHGVVVDLLAADVALALGRGSEVSRLGAGLGDGASAQLLEGRLLLLTGRPDQALARCEVLLQRELTARQRSEVLVLRAVAAHRGTEPGRAPEMTAAALAHLERHEHLRAWCTVPRSALDALAPEVTGLPRVLGTIDARGGREIYPEQVDLIVLTERERVVLNHLAQGRTLKETAAELFVSMNTVKTQTRSLYSRLGVSGRQEAVVEAARLGLIAPPR